MSLQVCSCCGWSKHTTYHGLRTHQGKMGCTPKGLSIPQSEQFRMSSYVPKLTYLPPPIKVEEPFTHIFTPSIKYEGEQNSWRDLWADSRLMDSGPVNSTLVKVESAPVSAQTGPTDAAVLDMLKSLFETQQLSHQTTSSLDKALDKVLDFSTGTQQPFLLPMSQTLSIQANLATSRVEVNEANKSLFETPQHSRQTAATARRALDFSAGAQQPSLMPVSQVFTTQENPAASGVVVNEANKSLFETPLQSKQTAATARQALDFSAGAQEVGRLFWDPPTTTAHEAAVQPKQSEVEREREMEMEKEREKEMENKRKKEREAQKLQKARISADLQQKIQMREQKIADVRSSVKACKGSLDSEWLEINNVFSEVTRVVEEARKKALQPLDERRETLKREAGDLIQKLQKEIDKLKNTIDVLNKPPNFQVPPLTGLDQFQDWKNVTVDSSSSFGTLRTTTSNMMEQIHQKLEKLCAVELKRIPTFAVDVKLDPTTAHGWLVLSPNGKKVRDGGKNQKVPDSPQRFEMFASVMGLNRLTSGKSYWEVEVSNKTGWDLGVASRNANRKGKLSLNPDNGYWVAVHYEGEKYAAMAAPPVSLSLTVKPQKVGVFVDYEDGVVSFYDVTAQSHIYSFTECSFSGEILPYFSPHLKQNERNSHPLIISAVTKQ